MAKHELKKLPPIDTDGIAYARTGTAVIAAISAISWLFRSQLFATDFAELPQISTAALVLGLIGTWHVTRRARRITQSQQNHQ